MSLPNNPNVRDWIVYGDDRILRGDWDDNSDLLILSNADLEFRLDANEDMAASIQCVLQQLDSPRCCLNCKQMQRGGMMLDDGCTMCYCTFGLDDSRPSMDNVSHLFQSCDHWEAVA